MGVNMGVRIEKDGYVRSLGDIATRYGGKSRHVILEAT